MNSQFKHIVGLGLALTLGLTLTGPLRAQTRETAATEPPQTELVPESEPTAPPSKKSGKLLLSSEDGRFSIRPLMLAQPIVVIPIDGEIDSPAAGSGIQLKRARLGAEATLFDISAIKIWGDFRNGTPELVDAYVDINPLDGALVVRAGWFRPWFGRQRLGSSSQFQLVETAMAWSDKRFGLNLNRDLGIALSGTAQDFFEWGIGIFNGEKTFALGGNRDMGMAARFAVHPLALGPGTSLEPGDETAYKMSEKPALSIGGALSFERRRDRSITPDPELDPLLYEDIQFKAGGEIAFQWSRIALLSELFWMKTAVDEDADADALAALDAESPTASLNGSGMGAYFQFGIMAVRDRLELAGRFDWVDEHLDTDGSRFYPAFGTNIYLKGHNLKLQAFYRAEVSVGYEEDHSAYRDRPTHLIEIMLQAGF